VEETLRLDEIGRRRFLQGAGVAALTAAGAMQSRESRAQHQVANSAGTDAPRLKAPAGACDCHMHIYDERFPVVSPWARMQRDASVAHYRALQKRIGTERTVVVTPAVYRTDNRVTLDAVAQLGEARGVAVVHPDVSDAELKVLADGGIRGIRFTVFDPATAATSIDMIEPLSRRVNELGWHVQIHMRADQIADNADLLGRLPSAIVLDHMGRFPQPAGTGHPAYEVIRRLIDKGRTWVKLSGAYMDTAAGPPGYGDKTKVARAFIDAAPERVVWGSDWPHPTEKEKPDDAVLLDLLSEWAPDEAMRHRILVTNPEALYGFPTGR
jgi:predicted TIM-barrel fold metal-dependent hydrolase